MIAVYKEPIVDVIGASVYLDTSRSREFPDWDPHDDNALEDTLELAGRGCYQSWDRPNPQTATMEGYIGHLLEVGHGSVLEHGSVTFYIQGISRALTHELVRHRHFGFSQLSQRFVNEEEFGIVVPPLLADDDRAVEELTRIASILQGAYSDMDEVAALAASDAGAKGFAARKMSREAARAVLPNMAETKVTVTGNMRAWRHFLSVRGAEGADAEIRRLACALVPYLSALAPSVFQDTHVANGVVHMEYGSV